MSDTDDKIQQLKKQISDAKLQLNSATSDNSHSVTWWSVNDAMTISATVLVFGLAISLMIGYLLAKGKHPEHLLRTFGTIVIIISAVFLVVAGYSDKQIAPVMGLLGTIAGYLLGKSSNGETNKS
ncbi:hypothetical protein P3W53_07105 [Pseudomonas denitrificans (nom. rej.)]|nr:hypothetical protein [Pseudomonas denitrificans (nom. rej.)]